MNSLKETVQKSDIATLWALVADVSMILEQRGYEAGICSKPFMFWYGVYNVIEAEIDKRLTVGFMEGCPDDE